MKLEEVARLANVSKTAASLALNGKPGVSENTRTKILKIAEENHYVPLRNHNKNKESDQKKIKIRFVACTNRDVIPENYRQLPFFNELLSYITTEINLRNHLLTMNSLPKDKLFQELSFLEETDPSDGIILLGTNLTSSHVSLLANFKRLVVLDTESSSADCNTITMNNYLGSYEAATYLMENGHREIGYVKGIPRINNFYGRRRGFKDALKKANLDPESLPKYYLPGMKIGMIEEDIDKFLKFVNSVSAIFCEDDYIAISIMKTLNKYNIKVPDDVSIIGFDDIPECQVTLPELTTIHVPIQEMAKEAIDQIENDLLNDSAIKRQIFLNTNLVKRNSVKSLN